MSRDTTDRDERLRFLFGDPDLLRHETGIDVRDAELADEGTVLMLVGAEHPAHDEDGWHEQDEFHSLDSSPHAHTAMHCIVVAQVLDDDRSEPWGTARRLLGMGYDRHEVLHMVTAPVTTQMHRILSGEHEWDEEEFRAELAELPASWEATRLEGDGLEDDLLGGGGPPMFDDERAQRLHEECGAELEHRLLDTSPSTVRDLAATAGPVAGIGDAELVEAVDEYLRWYCDWAVVGVDGTVWHESPFLDGLRVLHELSPEEVAAGRVEIGLDLFVALELPEPVSLRQGGEAVIHSFVGLGGPRSTDLWSEGEPPVFALDGPAGWLGDAEAGDLVAVEWSGGELGVGRGADRGDDLAVRAAARGFRRAFDRLDDEVVEIHHLFRETVVGDRSLLTPPAPVSELLAAAGLSTHGDFVADLDFDWEAREEALHERFLQWTIARSGIEDPGVAYRIDALLGRLGETGSLSWSVVDELAGLLTEPGAVGFVHESVKAPDRERWRGLVPEMLDAVPARHRGGLHGWAALLAQEAGVTSEVVDHVEEALGADLEDPSVLELAADVALDRGQLERARRLHERAETELDDRVAELLDPSGGLDAPRNAPCPCGSGRKFKRCHGRPGASATSDPVAVLIAKAHRFVQAGETMSLYSVFNALGAIDEHLFTDEELLWRTEALATDLLLHEGGVLRRYLELRGTLLPEPERELLERWLGTPLTVATVEGATLRPAGAGPPVTLAGSELADLDGETVVARIVTAPSGPAVTFPPLTVSVPAEELAAELAGSGEDHQAVATCLGTALAR